MHAYMTIHESAVCTLWQVYIHANHTKTRVFVDFDMHMCVWIRSIIHTVFKCHNTRLWEHTHTCTSYKLHTPYRYAHTHTHTWIYCTLLRCVKYDCRIHTYVYRYVHVFFIHTHICTIATHMCIGICMYSSYIHTCVHVYMYVLFIHTHMCTYVYDVFVIHTHIHTQVYACTCHLKLFKPSHLRTYTHMYICICMYSSYIHTYICTGICMCISLKALTLN